MADREYTQCPECGWTGERSELEDEECPVCAETIEFVD